MSEFPNEGIIDYSEPDPRGKFHLTNQFLKAAAQAMALPPETGAKVGRHILTSLAQALPRELAEGLKSALPAGLAQECELAGAGAHRGEISQNKIKQKIQAAAEPDPIDPEEAIANFGGFFRSWLEKNDPHDPEHFQKLMEGLPQEIAQMLRKDEKWAQDLL